MSRYLPHRIPWPGAAGWLVAAALAVVQLARGEDDRVVDDMPVPQPQQQQVNMVDLGANFDPNVFAQPGAGFSLVHKPVPPGGGEQPPQPPRSPAFAYARQVGDKRLAMIDAICDLSEDQRRKLRLAMESDVRELAEEIDGERQQYLGMAVNLGDKAGQQQWQQFQQDVRQCQQRLLGLFDADSLFAKVLPTTLDAKQFERLTAEHQDRRAYRWQAMVAATMLRFDDVLGLDQRQHEGLEALLLERQPALRIDRPVNRHDVHMRQMLVYMVLSEVAAERLQGIVSERQRNLLAQMANQGKAMRSHIEAQGLLEQVSK